MKSWEDELRSLLRRQEPPEGFTERVLERLAEQRGGARSSSKASRRSWLRWAAAAALVCILLGAGLTEVHRRREGEAAAAQTTLALRITSNRLNSVLKRAVDLEPQPPHGPIGGKSE